MDSESEADVMQACLCHWAVQEVVRQVANMSEGARGEMGWGEGAELVAEEYCLHLGISTTAGIDRIRNHMTAVAIVTLVVDAEVDWRRLSGRMNACPGITTLKLVVYETHLIQLFASGVVFQHVQTVGSACDCYAIGTTESAEAAMRRVFPCMESYTTCHFTPFMVHESLLSRNNDSCTMNGVK